MIDNRKIVFTAFTLNLPESIKKEHQRKTEFSLSCADAHLNILVAFLKGYIIKISISLYISFLRTSYVNDITYTPVTISAYGWLYLIFAKV